MVPRLATLDVETYTTSLINSGITKHVHNMYCIGLCFNSKPIVTKTFTLDTNVVDIVSAAIESLFLYAGVNKKLVVYVHGLNFDGVLL